MGMNTQFKKGILDLCVLTLIEKKDYYGYELVEKISSKFAITEGTIYPILKRLTEEDYFETYLKESSDGPPRKYYRITKKGRQYQANLIIEWTEFNKQVTALLEEEN